MNKKGPSSEIVFSSRIRLARNLNDYPFPSVASIAQKKEVLKRIKEVFTAAKDLKHSFFWEIEDLSSLDRQFLLERHVVSQEHVFDRDSENLAGRGLIISDDERISLMINEEDHLRLQCVTSGFDLHSCWQTLNAIDDDFSEKLSFAFLSDLGYLTACVTNLGTGLRASCMLHLPALVLTKNINKILELLAKISFTTRGLFGEGTQALGNFFQISNQVSLGVSEEELINNLTGVVNQVKEQEMDARANLLEGKYRISLEDMVWRAWGILENCRLINSTEALNHLSILSLGLDLGIIKNIEREVINSLFIIIQPAHLQKIEGKSLREDERDYIRAEILRSKLNSNN